MHAPRILLTRLKEFLLTSVKEHWSGWHWLFDFLQLAALGLAVFWSYRLPWPGYAIGVLAVAAAVMTVHSDMRGGHKVAWMLIIGAFLVIEFRAITKDRNDFADQQAQARKDENDKFNEIVDGLKESIRLSQEEFRATSYGIERSIANITGGKTFPVIKAMPIGNQFEMQIGVVGSNPLHEVTVQMTNVDLVKQLASENRAITIEERNSLVTEFPQISFLVSGSGRIVTLVPAGTSDARDFSFNFFSLNGNWVETLRMRRVNGQWEQAIRIMKTRGANEPLVSKYSWASKNYPKVNGKVNWTD